MNFGIDNVINALEQAKKYKNGKIEYWKGRDMQRILNYSSWEKFEHVIRKAYMACESSGIDPAKHFHQTVNLVEAGSGTMVEKGDYNLSRYACYLIAMNGATNKPEVATAQTYFALQTRRQEIQDQLPDAVRRIYLRERVRNENYKLAGVAKRAGVKSFSFFQDAGYRGLYTMSLSYIKNFKGLSKKDDLLDRAGRTELAANEFRITQTQDKIIREKIRGEENSIKAHYFVGRAVRDTISELGGTMPENLPPEPSIKKIKSSLKKKTKVLPKK